MTFLDFAAVIQLLRNNIEETLCPSQVELLEDLFIDVRISRGDQVSHFDPGRVSRWYKGTERPCKDIIDYYSRKEKQKVLACAVENYYLELIADPAWVAQKLYELVVAAVDVSALAKRELLEGWPAETRGEIAAFIARILRWTLLRPFRKRESEEKMLREMGGLSQEIQALVRSTKIPGPVTWFLGREKEMEELFQLLKEHGKVFLHGIPGVGKSELAKAFAKVYRKKYTNIIYLNYSKSLRRTIAAMDVATDRLEDSEEVRFQSHQQLLRSLRADSLLIVDNFDVTDTEDDCLCELLEYDCSILFTTRCCYAAEYQKMELTELSEEESWALMAYFYKKAGRHAETVQEIIRTVHRHTLAMEMAGRLLNGTMLQPKGLLTKLRRGVEDPDDDVVRIRKDGSPRKATYYNHIHTLFSLYRLNHREKDIMRNMILMPAEGVPAVMLGRWLRLRNMRSIDYLVEMGFIRECEESIIALHPMMRDVAIAEMTPSVSACKVLIGSLYEICRQCDRKFEGHIHLFRAVESIVSAVQVDEQVTYLRFLRSAFDYAEKYGVRDIMHLTLSRLITIMEEEELGTQADWALVRHDLACCVDNMEYAIALEQEALELLGEVTPENAYLAAAVHNYLGSMYRIRMDYQLAKTHMEQGLELMAEYSLADHHDRMIQKSNYATLMVDMGQIREAIEMVQKLVDKLRDGGCENSLDCAILMEELGGFYLIDRQHEAAVEHYTRAIRIYSAVYADEPELVAKKVQALRQEYMLGALNIGAVPDPRCLECN